MLNKTGSLKPLANCWNPVVGKETSDLLNYYSNLTDTARQKIIDSSIAILKCCKSPQRVSGRETGLVVGYVQSGKTLSFTTVSALACDNGYPIVIIITGTTTSLHRQSTKRLRKDLRYENPNRPRKWQFLDNPCNTSDIRRQIEGIFHDWSDPKTPNEEKETILITVMKHHKHLAHLRELFESVALNTIPVLIIDDEADQASLNTKIRQSKESTTFQKINELRAIISNNSFLQYTATPQAPLLINIIDALSPGFVVVLEPGDGYIGGKDFFLTHINSHVRRIPFEDVQAGEDDSCNVPPASLHEALQAFLIGIAAAEIKIGCRSMLVHPSFTRDKHSKYELWVRTAVNQWRSILNNGSLDPIYPETIEEFRKAYNEVLKTEPNLPSFNEILEKLPRAILKTQIKVINASQGKTPEIDWAASYAWILIGGQSMDRGFTVEGLTVTYMPRGTGVGNADTIQQRGRFFGYKKSYFGFCRVYLQDEVLDAFHHYVEHEEVMRQQLISHQLSGKSLDEWKRAFILSPELQPTRRNVFELDYLRGGISNTWFIPTYLLASKEAIETNRYLVNNFIENHNFSPDIGDERRTAGQRHLVVYDFPLKDILDKLLTRIRVAHPLDSQKNTGLLLQLEKANEQSNYLELCSVYIMSPQSKRERSITASGAVTKIFQGAHPTTKERRGEIYPGDHYIHHPDRVSIQIHKLCLKEHNMSGKILEDNVPVITVWIPSRLAASWIVQERE